MSFEDEFLSILKTELNVKSVDFVTQSSSFVEKKLTPNFPVLGKKHKNLMKELAVLISNLSKEQVSFFEKNNTLKILLNEKEIVLDEDDVVIKTSSVPGWSVVNNSEITVALDTKITTDLEKEGLAREFINRLQNLRKKHNYNVVDLVDISVFCKKALSLSLQKNLNYIMSEVLASKLNFLENKPNICEEVEINGSKVYIAIKLNPKDG
jgi:isoleucyl-tRNA synthetase